MYFKTYNMSWVEMIGHRRAGVTTAAATTDLTTAYRRSYALQVGLVWWSVGITLAGGYFAYVFRSFRGKVDSEE